MKKLFSARLSFPLLLLLLGLLLAPYFQQMASASAFCDEKCKVRCSKAGVQDRCLKYCGVCCEECKCVPSGTYGNKDECPCYRDKYTGEGKRRRPKCP
ncbi:peamaclein-like [Dendrobium catenatum]|uniref:Snakin-1 n=1 Tax=Dendrobium catenatum TaxID=906689 RepID=A0A2I0VR83_9ASPA|nr:peamaclein-like [Dendrobium catenatum]PKU65924.1 Snakin-1 [Dendrobium catenatum]